MKYLHIYQKNGKLNALFTPDHKIRMDRGVKPMGTVEIDDSTEAGQENMKALKTALQAKRRDPKAWLTPEKVQEYLRDVQKKDEKTPPDQEKHRTGNNYAEIFSSINPDTQVKIENIFDNAVDELGKLAGYSDNEAFVNSVRYLMTKLSTKPLLKNAMREAVGEKYSEDELHDILNEFIYQKVLNPIESLTGEDPNVKKFHQYLQKQLSLIEGNFGTSAKADKPAVAEVQGGSGQAMPDAVPSDEPVLPMSKNMAKKMAQKYPEVRKGIEAELRKSKLTDEQMRHAMNILKVFDREMGI